MKLSTEKRNRIILVIVAGVITSACLWYGLISSGDTRLVRSRERRVAAMERVEKARTRVAQAEKIEEEMEAAVQALRGIEEGMASGVDLYRWSYILMEKARAGHDVEISEVTRPQTNEVGVLASFPYPAATFTVKGVGYYHDFGKFLADFENRFPYFRVQNISLGNLAEAGGDSANTRVGKDKLFFKVDVVVPVKPGQ